MTDAAYVEIMMKTAMMTWASTLAVAATLGGCGGGDCVLLCSNSGATFEIVEDLAATDVNGDSHVDLVTGGSSAVAVLLQDGARPGMFQAASAFAANSTFAVAVAGMDEDGHPDILTTNGVSAPIVNGVMTVVPGVHYQDPTRPGCFLALQDLKEQWLKLLSMSDDIRAFVAANEGQLNQCLPPCQAWAKRRPVPQFANATRHFSHRS